MDIQQLHLLFLSVNAIFIISSSTFRNFTTNWTKKHIFYEHGSKTQFVSGKEVLEFIGFSMFCIW